MGSPYHASSQVLLLSINDRSTYDEWQNEKVHWVAKQKLHWRVELQTFALQVQCSTTELMKRDAFLMFLFCMVYKEISL